MNLLIWTYLYTLGHQTLQSAEWLTLTFCKSHPIFPFLSFFSLSKKNKRGFCSIQGGQYSSFEYIFFYNMCMLFVVGNFVYIVCWGTSCLCHMLWDTLFIFYFIFLHHGPPCVCCTAVSCHRSRPKSIWNLWQVGGGKRQRHIIVGYVHDGVILRRTPRKLLLPSPPFLPEPEKHLTQAHPILRCWWGLPEIVKVPFLVIHHLPIEPGVQRDKDDLGWVHNCLLSQRSSK